MSQNTIKLRGVIFREKNGKYYAISLTTNHISTGKTSEEAARKLLEQISGYIKWVHEQKKSDLEITDLRRPSPAVFWYKYFMAVIISNVIRLSGFGNDTIRMMSPTINKHQPEVYA